MIRRVTFCLVMMAGGSCFGQTQSQLAAKADCEDQQAFASSLIMGVEGGRTNAMSMKEAALVWKQQCTNAALLASGVVDVQLGNTDIVFGDADLANGHLQHLGGVGLWISANAYWSVGDYAEAKDLYESAEAVFSEATSPYGSFAQAQTWYWDAYERYEEAGEKFEEGSWGY